MKVFYNPETLQIMGSCGDDDCSMDFPFIETNEPYQAFRSVEVKIINKKPRLVPTKGTMNDEIFEENSRNFEIYKNTQKDKLKILKDYVKPKNSEISEIKNIKDIKEILNEIIN